MNKSIHRKKKITNLISKMLYITLIFTLMATVSLATDTSTVVGDMNSGTGVYGTLGEIIGILSWLAFLIAVGKMIQIGIMFMLGAGKSKNDAKSALIPWLVGAVVCALFGTLGPAIINLIMGSGSGGVFDI